MNQICQNREKMCWGDAVLIWSFPEYCGNAKTYKWWSCFPPVCCVVTFFVNPILLSLSCLRFKNVMFDISPAEEVGDFEVKAKFMGVEMEKVQLHFQVNTSQSSSPVNTKTRWQMVKCAFPVIGLLTGNVMEIKEIFSHCQVTRLSQLTSFVFLWLKTKMIYLVIKLSVIHSYLFCV